MNNGEGVHGIKKVEKHRSTLNSNRRSTLREFLILNLSESF